MSSKYQAVLFDFDGTLAPTLDLRDMKRRVVELTAHETRIARADIERMLIVEMIEHTAHWLDEQGRHSASYYEAAHALIRDIELDAARTTDLYPDIRKSLSQMKALGLSIGIVTRNCTEAVTMMFPDVGDYCESMLTRDDVEHLKPDTRHLEQCLRELDTDSTSAVMVGDGALDMTAGKALGMLCVGVLGGHSSRATLANAGADLIVARISELVDTPL